MSKSDNILDHNENKADYKFSRRSFKMAIFSILVVIMTILLNYITITHKAIDLHQRVAGIFIIMIMIISPMVSSIIGIIYGIRAIKEPHNVFKMVGITFNPLTLLLFLKIIGTIIHDAFTKMQNIN